MAGRCRRAIGCRRRASSRARRASHRSSVVRAYEELAALGYLASRCGAYSTVRAARPRATGGTLSAPRPCSTGAALVAPCGAAARADQSPADRDRGGKIASRRPRFLPADRGRGSRATPSCGAASRAVWSRRAGRRSTTATPGYLPLREAIARRLRTHGINASADEILVTGGSQQALDLVLRTLTRPGDRVAVEAPTYSMAHPLLRLHDVEVAEVPMRGDGLDLDALDAACAERRPALVYSIPNFHNPTGITTPRPTASACWPFARSTACPSWRTGSRRR